MEKKIDFKTRARGYETIFMLNSSEQEIPIPHEKRCWPLLQAGTFDFSSVSMINKHFHGLQ